MSEPVAGRSADKEQWRSGTGFVLATIGCAAGLGNIWRFSYVAGENGGGAFLLVYVVCVLLLGVPLMLGELCVGRRASMLQSTFICTAQSIQETERRAK